MDGMCKNGIGGFWGTHVSQTNHILDWLNTGATWWVWLNDPCTAALCLKSNYFYHGLRYASAHFSLSSMCYMAQKHTVSAVNVLAELTASLRHSSLSLSVLCFSWASSDSFLAFSASQTSCCRFLEDSDISPLSSRTAAPQQCKLNIWHN